MNKECAEYLNKTAGRWSKSKSDKVLKQMAAKSKPNTDKKIAKLAAKVDKLTKPLTAEEVKLLKDARKLMQKLSKRVEAIDDADFELERVRSEINTDIEKKHSAMSEDGVIFEEIRQDCICAKIYDKIDFFIANLFKQVKIDFDGEGMAFFRS